MAITPSLQHAQLGATTSNNSNKRPLMNRIKSSFTTYTASTSSSNSSSEDESSGSDNGGNDMNTTKSSKKLPQCWGHRGVSIRHILKHTLPLHCVYASVRSLSLCLRSPLHELRLALVLSDKRLDAAHAERDTCLLYRHSLTPSPSHLHSIFFLPSVYMAQWKLTRFTLHTLTSSPLAWQTFFSLSAIGIALVSHVYEIHRLQLLIQSEYCLWNNSYLYRVLRWGANSQLWIL